MYGILNSSHEANLLLIFYLLLNCMFTVWAELPCCQSVIVESDLCRTFALKLYFRMFHHGLLLQGVHFSKTSEEQS